MPPGARFVDGREDRGCLLRFAAGDGVSGLLLSLADFLRTREPHLPDAADDGPQAHDAADGGEEE